MEIYIMFSNINKFTKNRFLVFICFLLFSIVASAGVVKIHPSNRPHLNNSESHHQVSSNESQSTRPHEEVNSKKNQTNQEWTSTKKLSSKENITEHFNKHQKDFPNLKTEKAYVDATKKFINNPPQGTLSKIRGGDLILYHPETNVFAISDKNGVPRTMYKPDPASHGKSSNLEYFHSQ